MADEQIQVQLATPERRYVKIYNDFLRTENLTTEEKMVFIALKSFVTYGQDEGQVFPSLETLCRLTSMSRPRTTRAIKNLIRKGVVKKKRRGLKQSNLYTLYDSPAIWAAESEEEMCDLAKSSFPYTSEEMIEELKRRGAIEIIETKKEPVPATDQSSDTSVSSVKLNSNLYNNSNWRESESQDLYTIDDLRDRYAYDWMVEQASLDKELIDYVLQIICVALNSTEPTIRIKKATINRESVRSTLLALTDEEILFVIRKYKEQTVKIDNPEAYLLAMLYAAKGQMRADIDNQVRHDMF